MSTEVPRVGLDKAGRIMAMHVYPWHEAIGDLSGSAYIRSHRAWVMPSTPGYAAMLLTILSESGAQVSPKVAALAAEGFGRERSRALAADQAGPLPDLPWHEWLKTDPWPHQQRGIAWISGLSAALIAVTMGGGKSLMAVGGLNRRNAKKVAIAAPTAALGVWSRELRLHSRYEWHVENGVRRTPTGKLKRLSLEDRFAAQRDMMLHCACGRRHAMVVGYEAMSRDPLQSASLAELGIDGVIYDEGHRLKKVSGKASRTGASWVNQVAFCWALTGTPMPQSPDDIDGLYRSLDPCIFGTNHAYFRAEFIIMRKDKDDREFPVDVFPHKRLEFSRKFHSIAYLPVVDLKLPPATHSLVPVELESAARTAYDKLRDTGLAEITAAVVAAGGNPTPAGDERTVAPKNSGVELLRLMQFTGGSVNDDDGNPAVVSRAKAAALGEFTGDTLTGGLFYDVRCRPDLPPEERNPVTVFCRFTHDLRAIRGVAERAGLRYREISGARKDALDEDSKMVADADVVGVQIQAGGVAIDLTRSHTVVWYSVGLELWLFQQAVKRNHRPGQTRAVQYYYLVAEKTIDGAIYKALHKKENIIDSVVSAYLRHQAELVAEDLPLMATEAPSAGGDPAEVPPWMRAGPEPSPRKPADREADEMAALLAEAGLGGL